MEYELKYVNVFTTGKDGQLYKDKKGRPFCRVSIKVAEHGDNFVSGLFFDANCPWKVGDKVLLNISKEMYQDKEQLKFEIPRKEDKIAKHLEEINGRVLKIMLMVEQIGKAVVKPVKDDYPDLEKETGLKEGQPHPFDIEDERAVPE